MKKYLIDGRFLSSMSTGVDRYADQILTELDKISSDLNLSILIPGNAKKIPDYKNIKIIKTKKKRFWTQGVFGVYARLHCMVPINLCNEVSLLAPRGIVALHDACYAEDKEICPQVRDFSEEEKQWFQKIYQRIKKRAKIVLTVSEFSKQRITQLVGINPEIIHVVGNGWQHYENVQVHDNLMQQYPELKEKEYYFTLTSANGNKNAEWILKTAELNPQEQFVLAGRNLDRIADFSQYLNVLYVGPVDDTHVKTLMKHCKAFIFPSYYEGFGIPPLEALSVGAAIVVSNTACLPEIFQKSAHYIDPTVPQSEINRLMNEPVEAPENVLKRYSWADSARKLHEILV